MSSLRKILIIVIACLALTPPMLAVAADLEKGITAYRSGDYATALEELQPLAEASNSHAQSIVGTMYYYGDGTVQDYSQAFTWYKKAADQGHALAQFSLGWMYNKGQGTPQDYQQAVKWFKKASEKGVAVAQFKLGGMYFLGNGVPKDFVLAYMWTNIAAASGDEDAIKVRDLLQRQLTSAQIAEGQRLSRECVAKNYKNCP